MTKTVWLVPVEPDATIPKYNRIEYLRFYVNTVDKPDVMANDMAAQTTITKRVTTRKTTTLAVNIRRIANNKNEATTTIPPKLIKPIAKKTLLKTFAKMAGGLIGLTPQLTTDADEAKELNPYVWSLIEETS